MPETQTEEAQTVTVTTVADFLERFDAQAQEMGRSNGWCSNEYAYSYTGESRLRRGGSYRVPAPSRRESLGAMSIPVEFLNEAGLAKVQEDNAVTLAEMIDGAYAVMDYGLRNQNLTIEQAQAACRAIGIPEIRQERGHHGYARIVVYFDAPSYLDADGQRAWQNELRESMGQALSELIRAKGYTLRNASGNDPTGIEVRCPVDRDADTHNIIPAH